MNYWPTSLFLRSSVLSPAHKEELRQVAPGCPLSESTLYACRTVAGNVPSNGNSLVIIQSENAGMRRTYLNYPTNLEWMMLERSGFIAAENIFGFVMDALH